MSAAWQDFVLHWPSYIRLSVSSGVIERASSLAWRHDLRAYDSLHLASALTWQEVTGEEMIFACFDKRLARAAGQENLHTWPEGAGGI